MKEWSTRKSRSMERFNWIIIVKFKKKCQMFVRAINTSWSVTRDSHYGSIQTNWFVNGNNDSRHVNGWMCNIYGTTTTEQHITYIIDVLIFYELFNTNNRGFIRWGTGREFRSLYLIRRGVNIINTISVLPTSYWIFEEKNDV